MSSAIARYGRAINARRRRIALALLLAAGVGVHADATLRDPTRPPTIPTASHAITARAPGWRLTSTLVSRDRRIAVINRRTVEIGQHVDGARVLWIEPGRVRLRRGGREFTIRLLPEVVKRPVRHEATRAGMQTAAQARRQGGDP